MQHLLSPPGRQALEAVMQLQPLLAFDFDGTLAPIVPRPEDARVSGVLALQLAQLARLLPTAIVTGRSVADVTPRLGFTPRYIVGNHGAEEVGDAGLPDADAPATQLAMDALRQRIASRQRVLDQAEVLVEDKGHSLALHHRMARNQHQAVVAIQEVLLDLDPRLKRFGGKCVVNVVAASAPDKGDAIVSLVARCGAASAVFIGDDVNDEAVFARALPHWLTVRVGRDDPQSRAQFFLDVPIEVGDVVNHMLVALKNQR
jgi:trehalose 6-phosphate phosphatase